LTRTLPVGVERGEAPSPWGRLWRLCASIRRSVAGLRGARVILTPHGRVPSGIALAKRRFRTLRARCPPQAKLTEMTESDPMERLGIPAGDAAVQRALCEAGKGVDAGAPVLLVGECGTGKTTLARLLHRHGPRCREPFARVDCATALATAPFGAAGDAIGELRGTLFVDDLEELSAPLQRRLSRFLVEARRRDGHGFQLIAAARAPVTELVEQGFLRADLDESLYAGVSVVLPPLRERSGDIPAWAALFSEGGGRGLRISDAAMGYLLEYDWPGNLRELKVLVERLCRAGRTMISAEDLPPQIRWFIPGAVLFDMAPPAAESAFNPMAEEFQYRLIADALRRTWRR